MYMLTTHSQQMLHIAQIVNSDVATPHTVVLQQLEFSIFLRTSNPKAEKSSKVSEAYNM